MGWGGGGGGGGGGGCGGGGVVVWLCGCVVEAAAVEPVVEKAKDWKTGGEWAAAGR